MAAVQTLGFAELVKVVDVSIVITNYNKGNLVERAVRSALSQVFVRRTLEVLVIDDASTDDSMSCILDMNSDIQIIRHEVNKGVAEASNTGLRHSQGKFWLRLDADDYLSQLCVQYMASILESNDDLDFVYADHYRVEANGKVIERIRLNSQKNLLLHGAGVLFRKHAIDEIGGYDAELRTGEDFDLLARMIKSGRKGFYLPVPLYRYFLQSDSLTNQPDREGVIRNLENKYEL